MTAAFIVTAYLLMAVALAGWATFRALYRPWRLRGHSRTGRHLIRTADSLIALFGMSLLGAVLPIPLEVMAVVTVLVLGYLALVAWERVAILRREQADRRARDEQDAIEDTA